jgi:hypothetical protein
MFCRNNWKWHAKHVTEARKNSQDTLMNKELLLLWEDAVEKAADYLLKKDKPKHAQLKARHEFLEKDRQIINDRLPLLMQLENNAQEAGNKAQKALLEKEVAIKQLPRSPLAAP